MITYSVILYIRSVLIYILFSFIIIDYYYFIFFFFQAEDGIRDYKVTGVQTCALPISGSPARAVSRASYFLQDVWTGARTRRPKVASAMPGAGLARRSPRPTTCERPHLCS